MEWLDCHGNQLNPSQRDADPAPTIYVQAAEKFTMVKVRGMNFEVGINFSVEVAATVKDTLTTLPALDHSSKLEFSGRKRIKMRTLTTLLGGSY